MMMAPEKEQKGTSRVILVKKIIMRDGNVVSTDARYWHHDINVIVRVVWCYR